MTTFSGALREALREAMQKDHTVFVMGEDIGKYGGINNVTLDLYKEFGTDRVIDSPVAEIAIVGAGIGAAITGMRPVVEIMFADFIPIVMDQIINNAAKFYYISGGKTNVPLVIRTNFGIGKAEGAHQSQTPEAWFMNIPGIKVVMPSTPSDAYGLLLSSIWEDNPVLFLEHKMLYALEGEISDQPAPIPLQKADIKRSGKDITAVSCGLMMHRLLEAARELEKEGVDVEVIDMRTLKPFDQETVYASVKKTGRLVTVEENPYFGGWGLQVLDFVVSNLFNELKSPPKRLAALDVPVPAAKNLEEVYAPRVEDIKREIKRLLN
jgi:pyruvate dehydrogenase E1 component beta subunit